MKKKILLTFLALMGLVLPALADDTTYTIVFTVGTDTITYDGYEKKPGFVVQYPDANGGTQTVRDGDYTYAYTNNINAGTATLTVTRKTDNNVPTYWGDTPLTATFTINPASLTITAKNQSIDYGESIATGTDQVTAPDLKDSDAITAITLTPSTTDITTSGTITPSAATIMNGSNDATNNYTITYATGTLAINPKTVSAFDDNFTITLNPTSYTYDKTAKEPEVTVKYGEKGIPASCYTVAYQNNINAGTAKAVIRAATETNSNTVLPYIISFDNAQDPSVTKEFTINKAALTVKADAKTKVYGETDPELTYTSEGLVSGDNITGALTRDAGDAVGTYAITQGTLTAGDNYNITYTGANLTITPKTVKDNPDTASGESAIAIELSPTSYTYDKTEKKPTVTVKDGNTTIAATEYTVTYANNVNAGTATVTITDKDGGNYKVSGTKTFTITPAALTITADAKTKVEGEADPALTYTSEGLISGDAITGALTRDAGEAVGTYAIKQGTLTAGNNYTITYQSANLTITAKPDEPADAPTYNVIVAETEGGSVVSSLLKAEAGQQVNLVVTAASGYQLTALNVVKKGGGNVSTGITTDAQNQVYHYFLMPAADVTVTAVFEAVEGDQNIFIWKAKYGEVISHVLHAEPGDQVNLKAKPGKNSELDVDKLMVLNNEGQQLKIFSIDDPTEGLIYYFIMKGESVQVFNSFKGTNGTVDETQPAETDDELYLLSDDQGLLNTSDETSAAQLAMSAVANFLATFTPEGQLTVTPGDDIIAAVLNLKSGWQIKFEFTGDISCLNPEMLQGLADGNGTILSGTFYELLADGNLLLLLETATKSLNIESITIIASAPTAIGRLWADGDDADIYDLSGRKVDTSNLRKGVYIRNGKKFVIK